MIIRAEQISKAYRGKPVLEQVSLEIEPGTFWTVLGPTGVGKTTLLRILAGIEKPDCGRVTYDGVEIGRVPMTERSIAFVYQQFINYPSLTLYENIASPLRVSKEKVPEEAIDRKVRELAELLGLTAVLRHLPEQVSGGQQQRCAIGRALAKDAHHVLLDEPLANLDYKLREELRTELKQIFKRRAGSVLLATPDPVDVFIMATHVALLHEGRILQQGPVREVYQRPTHATVAAYFSHPPMNLIESKLVRQEDGSQFQISGTLQVPLAERRSDLRQPRYLLGIHPHHLALERLHPRMIPFPAHVELAEVVGSNTELHLRHENHRLVMLLPQVKQFASNQALNCYLDPERMLLFDPADGAFAGRLDSVSDHGQG